MSTLGSESWLDASETEPGSDLHTRATTFVDAVQWDALTSLASQMRDGRTCELSEKYSLGHFNLVRRLHFADGVSWVARLRLPELQSMFGAREALNVQGCMEIEIATMNFLKLKTNIPVPEVFGHNLKADNAIGAPYILMSYIHGTVAAELAEARECEPGCFGLPGQDERFWQQMASIHAELASLTFSQIGSLRQEAGRDQFTIGPEIETGEGPWDTPDQYYSALVRHRVGVAEHDAEPEVRQSESFSFPSKFLHLIQRHETRASGPYSLANRDFGAHNILVDDDFNIVGLIDFDGVIAAPSEVVAQFPDFMELDRPIPGFVQTGEFALAHMAKIRHLIPRYVGLVREAIVEKENETDRRDTSGIVDLFVSDAASVVQGLNAFGQLQDFVNDRWMAAYDMLLAKSEKPAATS